MRWVELVSGNWVNGCIQFRELSPDLWRGFIMHAFPDTFAWQVCHYGGQVCAWKPGTHFLLGYLQYKLWLISGKGRGNPEKSLLYKYSTEFIIAASTLRQNNQEHVMLLPSARKMWKYLACGHFMVVFALYMHNAHRRHNPPLEQIYPNPSRQIEKGNHAAIAREGSSRRI